MVENVWDELWKNKPAAQGIYFNQLDWEKKVKTEGDRLNTGITQLRECLGEYESKEWCSHCILDSKCAQITLHVNELKVKAEALQLLLKLYNYETQGEIKIATFCRTLLDEHDKLEAVKTWGEKYFPTFRQFAPIAKLEKIIEGLDIPGGM